MFYCAETTGFPQGPASLAMQSQPNSHPLHPTSTPFCFRHALNLLFPYCQRKAEKLVCIVGAASERKNRDARRILSFTILQLSMKSGKDTLMSHTFSLKEASAWASSAKADCLCLHLPLHPLWLHTSSSAVWSFLALSLGRGHLLSHLPPARGFLCASHSRIRRQIKGRHVVPEPERKKYKTYWKKYTGVTEQVLVYQTVRATLKRAFWWLKNADIKCYIMV